MTRVRWGSQGLLPSGSLPWGIAIGRPVLLTPGDGMLQQLWSFNSFPSCWQHKPLYPLQREIANCKGKEKINIVYALGQLCQCSLLCWNMLSLWKSAAPRPMVSWLQEFPFSSSVQNHLGSDSVLAVPVGLSPQSLQLGLWWRCGRVMQKG